MMYWKCPNCKSKIDFTSQMDLIFDEDGEADFDPEHGLSFHTIMCNKCNASWIMSISGVEYFDTKKIENKFAKDLFEKTCNEE